MKTVTTQINLQNAPVHGDSKALSITSLAKRVTDHLTDHVPAEHLTLLVTLPEQFEVSIIDDLEALPFKEFDVTITVPENARLTYRSSIVDTKREQLAGESLTNNVTLDTAPIKKNMRFVFSGQGAHGDIHCSYLSGKDRRFHLKTLQEHASKNTTSSLKVKGVFEGTSQFFCDNLIVIPKESQHVEAFQVNKNLLLSSTAKAISIPKMEVEANDVSCRHGAATSKIDPDQLFYLQSRGIAPQDAQEMVIKAFLH